MMVGGMNARCKSGNWSGSVAALALGALFKARMGSASPAMLGCAMGASSTELASGSPPLERARPNSWSSELGAAAAWPSSGISAAGAAAPSSSPSASRRGGDGPPPLSRRSEGANGSQSVGMPPAGGATGAAAGIALVPCLASGSNSGAPGAGVAAAAGPSKPEKGSAAAVAAAAPSLTLSS